LPDELQFYAIGAFVYTLPVIGALTSDAVFVPAIGYQKAFEFCRLVTLNVLLMMMTMTVSLVGKISRSAHTITFGWSILKFFLSN